MRRRSSAVGLGRKIIRPRRMRPWRKKMAAKRRMRMRRTENSVLAMFLVAERARSDWAVS